MHARLLVVATLLLSATLPAFAEIRARPVEWRSGQADFSGYLVYDDATKTRRPGLVMFPNWMGVDGLAVERAKAVAGKGYVVLVADVYGKGVRPKDGKEAAALVGKAYADGGTRLRSLANAAVSE